MYVFAQVSGESPPRTTRPTIRHCPPIVRRDIAPRPPIIALHRPAPPSAHASNVPTRLHGPIIRPTVRPTSPKTAAQPTPCPTVATVRPYHPSPSAPPSFTIAHRRASRPLTVPLTICSTVRPHHFCFTSPTIRSPVRSRPAHHPAHHPLTSAHRPPHRPPTIRSPQHPNTTQHHQPCTPSAHRYRSAQPSAHVRSQHPKPQPSIISPVTIRPPTAGGVRRASLIIQNTMGWRTSVLHHLSKASSVVLGAGVLGAVMSIDSIGGLGNLQSRFLGPRTPPTTTLRPARAPDPQAFHMLQPHRRPRLPLAGEAFFGGQHPVRLALPAGSVAAGFLKTLPLLLMIIPASVSRIHYADICRLRQTPPLREACGIPRGCGQRGLHRDHHSRCCPPDVRGVMIAAMAGAPSSLHHLHLQQRRHPTSPSTCGCCLPAPAARRGSEESHPRPPPAWLFIVALTVIGVPLAAASCAPAAAGQLVIYAQSGDVIPHAARFSPSSSWNQPDGPRTTATEAPASAANLHQERQEQKEVEENCLSRAAASASPKAWSSSQSATRRLPRASEPTDGVMVHTPSSCGFSDVDNARRHREDERKGRDAAEAAERARQLVAEMKSGSAWDRFVELLSPAAIRVGSLPTESNASKLF
uniref:Cytochrome-c oxidase n=1 Tax=Macrostomum lignano TaxID=282301 RepID=A0A1I8FFY7_9PLAT